jgi:phospholipid/cholesterol/gamma-HCH transport system substrate-binding protein
MESKVNFAVVGAFVIVLVAAMIGGTLWLASGTYRRQAYDIYETHMSESVSGLKVNAAVRYRGVDVGRVRGITLVPGNVELVRVTLDIERGTPVKVDTVATLQTQGLTGIAFIELDGGRKESAALQAAVGQPVPVIASRPSLLGRLETATPVLMASLTRIGDNLNEVLDEPNRRALRATLADLATLTQTLARRASTIDAALLSSARATDNAARVSAQLPQLVQRFERSADALERMASDVSQTSAGLRNTLDSARGAFDSARGTLDSARGTLDGSRAEVTQFTATALPEARELLVELRGLTATMNRVADEVERNPGVLLQGRRAGKRGPGE